VHGYETPLVAAKSNIRNKRLLQRSTCSCEVRFSGALEKLRKVTISFFVFVLPSASSNSGRILIKFDI
jgi:hypothetical protein